MSSDEISETIFGDKNAFALDLPSRFSIKDLHLAHPCPLLKKSHFIIVLDIRVNYRGHFTKLGGRSANQNFTQVRTIDSAAGDTTGSSGSTERMHPALVSLRHPKTVISELSRTS